MNENGPTPPTSPLPRWYRLLAVALSVGFWLLVMLVTVLVWAWRAPEGPRLTPFLFGLEVVLLVSALTVGRKTFWRLVTVKYRLQLTWPGRAAIVVIPLAMILAASPALFRRGEPVLDATGHRVAVVGSGSAGMHAAWMLHQAGIEFDVYEAADYVGGHAYAPVFTPETGEPFACDIGFIFGSPTDYQEMKVLMDWHGVERNPSKLGMSGLVDGYQWASGPDVSSEAKRFHDLCQEQHQDPKWNLVPFGAWLKLNGFDQDFRDRYLTPMMSVLFITDLGLYEISARFMLNMGAGRIQWVDFLSGAPAWTVKGGSAAYYEKLGAPFKDRIQLNTPVSKIERKGGKVELTAYSAAGQKKTAIYDDVILAVPGDVAHQLVSDKDWVEDFILGQVRYRDSEVVLHTDDSLLPEEKYRRQYNYFQDSEAHPGEFELTGIMNWVHGAGEMSPLPIGSLNPLRPIDPDKIILRRGWRHHTMDLWHLALMLEGLPTIQGRGGVWYAGDWATVIGHGPAMRTGMAAACNVGAKTRVGKTISSGAPGEPRCIDVTTEEERAGLPAVHEHLCGTDEIFGYLVERTCNGFKL